MEQLNVPSTRIRTTYLRINEGEERQQLSLILAGLLWSESKAAQILDKVEVVQYSGKKWFMSEWETVQRVLAALEGSLTYKGIDLKDRLDILKDWTWANEDSE